MVNGALHMVSDPLDLRLEQSDPCLKLGHRHGIKILPGQLVQRIAGPSALNLVCIHGYSVDRSGVDVNKGAGRGDARQFLGAAGFR